MITFNSLVIASCCFYPADYDRLEIISPEIRIDMKFVTFAQRVEEIAKKKKDKMRLQRQQQVPYKLFEIC